MDSFGLERSIEPRHALAQQAWKIDNTMTLRSDEVLIDVKIININLASFNEILDETGEDRALLCQRVLEIVRERGKLHNPVTNSGGMLYGTVVELGPSYPNIYHIRPKDEIISLSSLTVTPLHITQILRIDCESAQLEVEGQAILYANSPVVKKPPDLPLRAVIAAMDEAGAPTRSYQIVQPGQDVLILGASGRIGLMCGYAAKDKMGSSGRLVGIVRDQESRIQMEPCSVFDEVLELDATNLSALCGTPHAEIIQRFDVVINCINTADTEAASLLAVKNHGTIYFATICCDYKFVALTAESIGKEIQVIPYTGFLEGHADYTLGLMRRFPQMQTDIQRGICGVPETISIPNSDETPHAKSEADEDCASGYIFHSLEAKATLRQALKVARYTSNVMIYGESGVGKEIIARIIHQNSERKSFPMVKINCAAIPEHLLESLGAKALEFLENQSFRGNIRELQNLIQRLMIMTNNRIIEARDVLQVLSMDSVEPPSVAAAVPSPDFHKQTTGGSLKEMLSQREREILQLYQQRYKSTRKIANMLGISQSSVVRKLNLYGLQSEDK